MMKLLLFLVILSIITIATADKFSVLDTDGDPLRPDHQYYIVPRKTDIAAGGLTLASRNCSCPLRVAQTPRADDLGLPVTFTPANPNYDTIYFDMDVNVEFSTSMSTTCKESTVWMLAGPDKVSNRAYITTGGFKGKSGDPETLKYWFRIERFNGVYRLAFCPTVCHECVPKCGVFGVEVVEGQRWLVLGRYDQDECPFRFKKA